MSRVSLIALVLITFILLLWRLDHVSSELEQAKTDAADAAQAISDLNAALDKRKALDEQSQITQEQLEQEKSRAQEYADSLRRCLADGTCGLYVAATCPVSDGGAEPATSGNDARAPRLTPAAERAYPSLVAGIKSQRAQIIALQSELKELHAACKLVR